jgi:hypothetical protein
MLAQGTAHGICGHTATHIKQPIHKLREIITTPLLFTEMAQVGQAATQTWH